MNNKYYSPSISGLRPYVAGEQRAGSCIKLNSNENPWPPSPRVIERLRQAAGSGLQAYPDADNLALRKVLAACHGLEVDNIFVSNGSDEVLAHAFKAFFQQRLPIFFPDISYSFYPVFCQYFGISYQRIAVDAALQIQLQDYPAKNGGVIFPNPNAPTGAWLPPDSIARWLEGNRASVVIIDEAYVDFAPQSALPLCREFDNLLVTQSLSKSRSLAGMRIGFAVGAPQLIHALRCVQNCFNAYPVDRLAAIAAIAAYEDAEYFQQARDNIIQTRTWTAERLTELGFIVHPSQANFILVQPPDLSAHAYYQALKERNILVRYFNDALVNDYVRISIGTRKDMQTLIAASKNILGKTS